LLISVIFCIKFGHFAKQDDDQEQLSRDFRTVERILWKALEKSRRKAREIFAKEAM